MFCVSCGAEIKSQNKFCGECGRTLSIVKKNYRKLYLLPILLGIIGGIIMFLLLKNENPEKAKDGLLWGFIVTGIVVSIELILMILGIPVYL